LRNGAVGAGLIAAPGTLLRPALRAEAPRFAKVPHFTVPLPIPAKVTPVGANTFHIAQARDPTSPTSAARSDDGLGGNPFHTDWWNEYRQSQVQTVTYRTPSRRDAHDTGHEPNPIGIPGDRYEIPS